MAITIHEPKEKKNHCLSNIREAFEYWAPEAYHDADAGTLHAKISGGNDKIGRTLNISTPPVIACGNCSVCMHECYAVRNFLMFWHGETSTARAWTRNYIRFITDPAGFFDDIDAQLTEYEDGVKNQLAKFGYSVPNIIYYFFRWHVSGDIMNAEYFAGMKMIAEKHPGCLFLAFTKMYDVVNAAPEKPTNLQIVFSRWYGVPCDNPYHFPECYLNYADPSRNEFYSVPETMRHYCGGDCETCNAARSGCWHLLPGQCTVINQH